MDLKFSPSGMTTFTECREKYRLRYIEGVESSEPDIHLTYGRACHKIPECYWRGLPQEAAFTEAMAVCGEIGPPMLLPSKLRDKWLSLLDGLMESVEAYYEFHGSEPRRAERPERIQSTPSEAGDEYSIGGHHRQLAPSAEMPTDPPVHMLEQEFQYMLPGSCDDFDNSGRPVIYVTGRIDQYIGTTLRELKTASEIGANWKHDYRQYLLRNWGIMVYDWYLCQLAERSEATRALRVEVEVLVKPYRDKRPRMELFDITKEVVAYRERTSQQLEWICREMAEYHLRYAAVSPWPMAPDRVCKGLFPCDYLVGCNTGHEKAAEKGFYKIRDSKGLRERVK